MLNPLDHPICYTIPRRLTPASQWHEHIPFAMLLVDLLRPNTIVELGTHYGDSYCAFCQAVKDLETHTQCYAVDTWQGDAHSGFYGPDVLADLRAHHDPFYSSFSCLIQADFNDALSHFKEGEIDVLHIDGYHTYEAVRHTFESWRPKVSSRGVILFHDTNVREEDFGVDKLWETLKKQHPRRYLEFSHGHGLGVLAVGEPQSSEFQRMLDATDDEMSRIQDFFFQLGYRLTLTKQIMEQRVEQAHIAEERHVEQAHVAALSAQVAEKDQGIAALQSQGAALSAQVAEKGQEVAVLSAHVAAREQTLQALLSRERR